MEKAEILTLALMQLSVRVALAKHSRPKHTLQICISCENVSLIGYKRRWNGLITRDVPARLGPLILEIRVYILGPGMITLSPS